MTINNLPEYAKNYKYIVARKYNEEAWFYGAYDTEKEADQVAEKINGFVWLQWEDDSDYEPSAEDYKEWLYGWLEG